VIFRKFFLAFLENVETSVQKPTIKEREEILQRQEGEIGMLKELSRVLDASRY